MNVVILRGLPGVGKSTWIKENFPLPLPGGCRSGIIVSADHFHMVDGVYRFDPTKIKEAHDCCLRNYIEVLARQSENATIYVDNTNIHAWELAPFVRLAEIDSVTYEIVTLWGDPVKCARRNSHGVPASVILAMYQNLLAERLPSFWKQRIEWVD